MLQSTPKFEILNRPKGIQPDGESLVRKFRKEGKLAEAYLEGKKQISLNPKNIWNKRDFSWVLYDYLKLNCSVTKFNEFKGYLDEIKELQLPEDEKMLFDSVGWQIGKIVFALLREEHVDIHNFTELFDAIRTYHFTKTSDCYTFIFKAFHKAFKNSDQYIDFADWWNLENFTPKDYEKEKMPNGKDMMSLVEQAYIAYAKHLLPKSFDFGNASFNKERALAFMPKLDKIIEEHLDYQYPAYYKAKLLLALGDKENMLSALLPFARKKKNDFWVWDVFSEVFSNDQEKVLACYCKALSCTSPDEMLVSLRQRMAAIMVKRQLFNEAKTEIDLLVKARVASGYKVPNEVSGWQSEDWYQKAEAKKSNLEFYKQFSDKAEELLFSNVPEEMVIVEFVNSDRKMLNFIASEKKYGFFKYDRFLREARVGDVLKVRFQGGSNGEKYLVYTVSKTLDEAFQKQFMKEVEGDVRIPIGKAFGFLNDIFIHPSVLKKNPIVDGMHIKGMAMKSYNPEKKQWGWKMLNMEAR